MHKRPLTHTHMYTITHTHTHAHDRPTSIKIYAHVRNGTAFINICCSAAALLSLCLSWPISKRWCSLRPHSARHEKYIAHVGQLPLCTNVSLEFAFHLLSMLSTPKEMMGITGLWGRDFWMGRDWDGFFLRDCVMYPT